MVALPVSPSLILQAIEEYLPDRAPDLLPETRRNYKSKPPPLVPETSKSREDRVRLLARRRRKKVGLWHPKDVIPRNMDQGIVDHEQGGNGTTRELDADIIILS